MKYSLTFIFLFFSCHLLLAQIDTATKLSIDIRPLKALTGELPMGVTIYKKKGKRSESYGAGPVFFNIYSNGEGAKLSGSKGAMTYTGFRFNRIRSFFEIRNENKFLVREDIFKRYGRAATFRFPGSGAVCESCASIQTDKVLVNKVMLVYGYRGMTERKIYFEPYIALGMKMVNSFYNIREIYDYDVQYHFRFTDYKLRFQNFYPFINIGFSTGIRL